jgi:hypothetical protein
LDTFIELPDKISGSLINAVNSCHKKSIIEIIKQIFSQLGGIALGTRFNASCESILFTKSNRLRKCNFFLLGQINLGSNKDNVFQFHFGYIRVILIISNGVHVLPLFTMLGVYKLDQLLLQWLKAGFAIDIVDSDAAMCIPEVSLADGPKPFLPSRVPNLDFDGFFVNFQCFYFEVHADGLQRSRVKSIFSEPEEQRCFSDSAVSDEHDFVESFALLSVDFLRVFRHSGPNQR